jgi:hypothetical protein
MVAETPIKVHPIFGTSHLVLGTIFFNRVSLYSPSWPWTHGSPALDSQVQELCVTVPCLGTVVSYSATWLHHMLDDNSQAPYICSRAAAMWPCPASRYTQKWSWRFGGTEGGRPHQTRPWRANSSIWRSFLIFRWWCFHILDFGLSLRSHALGRQLAANSYLSTEFKVQIPMTY